MNREDSKEAAWTAPEAAPSPTPWVSWSGGGARRPAPCSSLSANRPHARGPEGRGPSGPELRALKREVAGSFHPRPQPRGASFQGSQPCFPAAGPPDSHSQAGPLSPELAQRSGIVQLPWYQAPPTPARDLPPRSCWPLYGSRFLWSCCFQTALPFVQVSAS